MRFADLNWMDIERYLAHDDRVILVTGATEQHAYLSLLTDIKIPEAIATAVAERTGILVAPPLNFGLSGYFMEYPGTISLSQHTFELVLTEMVQSLMQHGFSRFLILNGHGGNGNDLPPALDNLQREIDEVRIVWYSWWHSHAVTEIAEKIGAVSTHASWMENFPFTKVAEVPGGVKPEPLYSGVHPTRDELDDGSFGGPYEAPADIMNKLFEALVTEVEMLVQVL